MCGGLLGRHTLYSAGTPFADSSPVMPNGLLYSRYRGAPCYC